MVEGVGKTKSNDKELTHGSFTSKLIYILQEDDSLLQGSTLHLTWDIIVGSISLLLFARILLQHPKIPGDGLRVRFALYFPVLTARFLPCLKALIDQLCIKLVLPDDDDDKAGQALETIMFCSLAPDLPATFGTLDTHCWLLGLFTDSMYI